MQHDDSTTRASLLWRLKSDQDHVRQIAWHEFHACYAPTIRRFAVRMGATAEQAEDVAQDVMLGFFSANPEFVYDPRQGRFRGYLKTCVCRALQRHRKRFAVPTIPGDHLDGASAETGQIWDELWEQRLLERATATYLESCDARKNELFRRSVLEGESPQSVAAVLGMTVEAVYKARQRGLTEFRQVLQILADDEP